MTSASAESGETGIIRVAIIEDKREISEGLGILINGTVGFRCVGNFGSMEEALDGIGRCAPHIALVDIGLPGMSGIEGIRILKEQHPSLLMLMLTVYDDDERIFDALCAGACGYLLKKTPPARIIDSLREAVDGGSPMTPEVARRVVSLFRNVRTRPPAAFALTPHETRLLKMLVDGHNYKTAAAALGVSVNTISYHVRHVYEKLQVHTKYEAVAKALQHRLVEE